MAYGKRAGVSINRFLHDEQGCCIFQVDPLAQSAVHCPHTGSFSLLFIASGISACPFPACLEQWPAFNNSGIGTDSRGRLCNQRLFRYQHRSYNKPGRQVVGKQVTRRWAILWHSLLSFIGVALGFYVGWKAGVWWIGPSNLMCALLLFVYSTTFKKRLLSGNVIIALLTAWTIALPGLASFLTCITRALETSGFACPGVALYAACMPPLPLLSR
jgi:hypothetical protein